MSSDEPKPVLAQNVRKAAKPLFAAELGIDDGMIDDIVAMQRAWPRLMNGRCIDVTDAEAREVRHDGRGVRRR